MNPFIAFNNILETYISKDVIKELPHRWNEKHRAYHNTNHLIQILQDIEKHLSFNSLSLNQKHALLIAAFFHDIIYDPKKKDNEDKSFEFFMKSYIGKDPKMIATVHDLIEVTKYRKRPTKLLERIFWDADNAGFMKGYDIILKNEKLIKKEYSYLSKDEYKQNRIKFLNTCIGLFNSSVDKDIKKLMEYITKY